MDNTISVVNDRKTQSEVAMWLHEHNADDLVPAFEQQGYTELADLTPEALDKMLKDNKPGLAARLKRALRQAGRSPMPPPNLAPGTSFDLSAPSYRPRPALPSKYPRAERATNQ